MIRQCLEDARAAVHESDRAGAAQPLTPAAAATSREVRLLRDALRALIQATEELRLRSEDTLS